MLAALYLSLFSSPIPSPQTRPNKNQPLPYDDADGYQVLSIVIEKRITKSKSDAISIFDRTISEENLKAVRIQCSGSIPGEFQNAAEDFDKKARIKFLLEQKFPIRRKYNLVPLSRAASTRIGDRVQTGHVSGVFSVSAVGFDEARTHSIALVRYIVHNGGTIGGDGTFYLLRKTENGWQEAPEIPKCGRIY